MPYSSLSDSLRGGLNTDPFLALQPEPDPQPPPMTPPPRRGGDFMTLLLRLLQSLGTKGAPGVRPGFADGGPPMGTSLYGAQPGKDFMGYGSGR